MARYTGSRRSITPSLTNDNWFLQSGTSTSGRILEVSWGGEGTTSTAMCTRVARSSSYSGNASTGNVAKIHPIHVTNTIVYGTTHATTQATLDAGDLFLASWNSHGGVIRWLAAPGEEFVIIGAATATVISCRNSVGTGTSSYGKYCRAA
jgi:hypothetical protein